MPSIIQGYNYDIFISYRQKDNKGDMWVSEFVEALKTELESTFKEEVSVYFDINPHDGLLETHDVDESLKEKLKCLIFIPIISRTYCDPKSFAWEHEFKAFVDQALQDKFGLKIKLPGGNVASRVLPVRIYDLDTADIELCESITGGILRGIDFIYMSPGVNRPLRADEDHPQDNLNKTYYRDQINKVANSIKELITGIRQSEGKPAEVAVIGTQPASTTGKWHRNKLIAGSAIVLILIILGILFLPKLISPKEAIEKSIAVLPFKNLSEESGNEYFTDGLVEDLLNRISVIEDLKVISRTSSEMFRDRGLQSVPEIARQLGVSYIVEGSVQRYGDRARVTVQLIDAINDDHIWSENYDRDLVDIFKTQSEIAMGIASKLNAILTSGQETQMQENRTSSIKAFELYQMGRFYWNKRTGDGYKTSIGYFEQAIDEDPDYGLAYAGLADTYNLMALQGWIDEHEGRDKAVELATKALDLDGNLAEAYTVLGQIYDYVDWDWGKAEKVFRKAFEVNPSYATAHHYYSEHLSIIGQHAEARKHVNKAIELDPLAPVLRRVSVKLYYNQGLFSDALREMQKCYELESDFPLAYYEYRIYWQLGDEEKAFQAFKKNYNQSYDLAAADSIFKTSGFDSVIDWWIEIAKTRAESEGYGMVSLAEMLGMIGKDEEALYWLERIGGFAEMPFHIHFKNLHDNPRYVALLDKMGLSEYWGKG
ncbi:MAG: tetratricopeptide repeat protein [Bacteroidales bacterium]|nr:tetratricopeptide repeat protein [Bacteroidales bacterium]